VRCNSDSLQDCVVAHLAPEFNMTCETAGRQWSHGKCPACRSMSLSLAIKAGRSLLWTCHRKPTPAFPLPPCSYKAILAGAAAIAPLCVSLTAKSRKTITPDDLVPLLELSDCALRLRVACMAWQMTPKEAAAKLGMSRATYYRAVSDVRQNRRSARVSDLRHQVIGCTTPTSLISETEMQVREVENDKRDELTETGTLVSPRGGHARAPGARGARTGT
jgi:predicted DNA-binding protein (UPF0251 family)